ncbi:hypothetical protein Btru_005091 [Bulinus truncatus]|nr:hypothetical protein Btru_005091 [Bulinus truncatus]
MAGWSGFSDEDLRKMRLANLAENSSNTLKQGRSTAARGLKSNRQPRQNIASSQEVQQENVKLSRDSSLETKTAVIETNQNNNRRDPVPATQHKEALPQTVVSSSEENSKEKLSDSSSPLEKSQNEIKELNETEALNVELSNVQKFQQQQKVIEEANKHKRALLAQAIENRRKKAKAEAEKLMRVQQELNHLDTLLTSDVSIIRDRIEVASLDYNEAQKRYEKAEKEFIAAKMDLFAKGEVKEQLTEHLYTIIHQNEIRKAKKLVELMEKLAMEVTAEEWELTIPAIPQLTNFTAVATLHGPSPHNKNEKIEAAGKLNEPDKNDSVDITSTEEIQFSETGIPSESQNHLLVDGETKPLVQTTLQSEQVAQVSCTTSDLPANDNAQDVNKNISSSQSCGGNMSPDLSTLNHTDSKCEEVTAIICTDKEKADAPIDSSSAISSTGWKHPFS